MRLGSINIAQCDPEHNIQTNLEQEKRGNTNHNTIRSEPVSEWDYWPLHLGYGAIFLYMLFGIRENVLLVAKYQGVPLEIGYITSTCHSIKHFHTTSYRSTPIGLIQSEKRITGADFSQDSQGLEKLLVALLIKIFSVL